MNIISLLQEKGNWLGNDFITVKQRLNGCVRYRYGHYINNKVWTLSLGLFVTLCKPYPERRKMQKRTFLNSALNPYIIRLCGEIPKIKNVP